MNALSYLIPILIFVIQILIINYLFQLERTGCNCAMDYKRTYILTYLVINALFVILNLFTNVFKYTSNNKISSFLMSIYSLGGIVNISFIIQYVNMLKAKKCECSESIYRDLMYIVAVIDALVLGLALLLVFYVVSFSAKDKFKLSLKKRKVR
jgi:apolipoprotein N-acyltransferase